MAGRRTIVCFGDSNTFGVVPSLVRGGGHRFAPERRWPGIMRKQLGEGFDIIEEGHPGRTTVHDDPVDGAHKNGRKALPITLESHAPIDMMILMLGINDLKMRFSVPPSDIIDSVEILINDIRASSAGHGGQPPVVLLVCPPPLRELGRLADMLTGAEMKSARFPELFLDLARRTDVLFLDAASLIEVSAVDGIHLDGEAHKILGQALAKLVKAHYARTNN